MKYEIVKNCSWKEWAGTPGGDAGGIAALPPEVVAHLLAMGNIVERPTVQTPAGETE